MRPSYPCEGCGATGEELYDGGLCAECYDERGGKMNRTTLERIIDGAFVAGCQHGAHYLLDPDGARTRYHRALNEARAAGLAVANGEGRGE